jgi:hypothetical protein
MKNYSHLSVRVGYRMEFTMECLMILILKSKMFANGLKIGGSWVNLSTGSSKYRRVQKREKM